MPDASATSSTRFGLAGKIFVASALLIAAVLGVTFGVTSYQANRTADSGVARALAAARTAVEDFLGARTRTLARASTVATDVPQYRERLLKRGKNRADALDQANDVRDLIGAAWVLVTDNQGILIARSDYPDQFDINLSGAPLVANALSGESSSGAWLDDVRNKMFFAVGTPLRASAEAGAQGALVATYEVNDSLAQAIHQSAGSDVVFFALDTLNHPYVVASTLPREEIGPALVAGMNADELARDTAGEAMTARVGGAHLIGLAGAIRSTAGDLRGGFVAFRSRDAELAAFRTLQRTILGAIVLGIILALASAGVLARHIAKPVQQLARATRKVQDGDYSVDIPVSSHDEIGVLSQAFRSLVEDLREKAQLVELMTQAAAGSATQPLASAPTAIREVAERPSLGSGGDRLTPGSVFANRYEVKEILGAGGMGVVYRAFDRELGEPVAIKTLRPDTVADDPVALERFKQEIRLARRIAHRNVVRTYDLGEVNGIYYLTMEYVEGTSLKQLIQSRGRLPVPVSLTVGKQLCRALEVAHEQGVIHRDIKPQNIVVEANGFLKVMDFGIARLANPPKGKGLTEQGMAIGTPDYMSPEQLSGLELDPRSDLYSAGVVIFESITGRVPFEADTPWSLIAQHLEQEPPDPRSVNPDVPEPLAKAVLKAMAKDRENRYQTAGEMYDALAAIG
ncbi:MAG TPA: protein kinase [Gemmatimonadales bacterium]|nr:protein kinase [Gemmatimonadales bacterium]